MQKILKSKYYVVEAEVTEGGRDFKWNITDRVVSPETPIRLAQAAKTEADRLNIHKYGPGYIYGKVGLHEGEIVYHYLSGRKILEIREARRIREELETMPDPGRKETPMGNSKKGTLPEKGPLTTEEKGPKPEPEPKKVTSTQARKTPNDNRPKKGSTIKVEPIRKPKDIKLIKSLLESKPLDYAFFIVGINTNLRASDILNIKVGQVRNLGPGESFEIREQKTKKFRQVTFNRACCEAVEKVLSGRSDLRDGTYLFTGQRGRWTVPTVSRKVKTWCRTINLKGNYAAHTLRKTWGFHQYHTFKQPLPVLTECFNHASQRQTLDYLCIQAEEVRDVFMNEL